MPESPDLLDQYLKLVEGRSPSEKTATIIHNMDQNIALIKAQGAQLGLDLSNPDQLADFIKAHVLISAWTITHTHTSCGSPSCLAATMGHLHAAVGHLGIHLKEMTRHSV